MWYENEADVYIEAMKQHFGVKTMAQLGAHLGVGQPSISAWKSRNAVELIQNRCLELGIFQEIFENPKIKDELEKIRLPHNSFTQHGPQSAQVGVQNNQGAGVDYSAALEGVEKTDLTPLFKALQAVAVAFKKEDFVKKEIEKLIAEIAAG